MYKNRILKSAAIIGCVSLIVGCGSSSNTPSNNPVGYNGTLIDAAVSGAGWSCGAASGITGTDGSFGTCPAGTSVTFTIGNVILGTITATDDFIFTPQDIAGVPRDSTDSPAASAIAATLLSLDSDGNPDNGITITPKVATAYSSAVGTTTPDFSTISDADIAATVAATSTAAGITLEPVTTDAAVVHLIATKDDIGAGVIAPPIQPTDASTN